MPSVNLGPAALITPQTEAVMAPQNANLNAPQGLAGYRLLAIARAVPLGATGDVVIMGIINSSYWAPALIVTANGAVSGVAGSIATAAIAVNSGPAGAAPVIKANATLANNSAANSAIALATTIANVAYTTQNLYINVGTALANATVDVLLYGYDLSAYAP